LGSVGSGVPEASLVRVASTYQVPVDEFLICSVDGVEIGVAFADGKYFAVRNVCPHQGAPICQGSIAGTMLPSEPGEFRYGMDHRVLVCPWHQFEFGLETGRPVFTNVKGKLRLYPVVVKGTDVFVELRRQPLISSSTKPSTT
jgi:nitrite reductase (NADH) small subunit